MMAQYLFFLILFTAILIHAFLGRGHAPTPTHPNPLHFSREAAGAKVCSSVALHPCEQDFCELPSKSFDSLNKSFLQGYSLVLIKKKRRSRRRVFEHETRQRPVTPASLKVVKKVLEDFPSQLLILSRYVLTTLAACTWTQIMGTKAQSD